MGFLTVGSLRIFMCIPVFFFMHLGSRSTACEENIGRSCDSWKMRCVRVYDNVTICMTKKKKNERRTLGDCIQIVVYVCANKHA